MAELDQTVAGGADAAATAPGAGEDRMVRLAEYRPPAWLVDDVRLDIDLAPRATRVRARIAFRLNPEHEGSALPPLRLDGRNMALVAATVDGRDIRQDPALTQSREGLELAASALPGPAFAWDCTVEIDPEANTELEGLYLSGGMFCTQCEAEGFRKITFYPDRPDVMAPFTVRLEAPVESCPVLLSNGNPGETGPAGEGRHYAIWHDPHPKPAYLFALVAGDLVAHRDRFTTASGREVALAVWVRPGDEARCAYAMDALIRSMRWDERVYGREYDLDQFNIVAVADFNMGAMENKGLNIFNSKYVLASPETATDRDYELIEGIVAHEYFHNWTGNRITCRDWFQLCLKEGLTVFRDQCFSEDERSSAVARIDQVKTLRARQFAEDAGPLAHPVRPEAYKEINNFYTATVYEKGAEVIRILYGLAGPEGYRKALDLYFDRHDGQACTIEQFRTCFEDALADDSVLSDLGDFARWWHQAGTPRLALSERWEAAEGRYRLTVRQETPPTPGQPDKAPLILPVAYALLDGEGAEIGGEQVLMLDGPEASVEVEGLAARPVLSFNRRFSVPAVVAQESTADDRLFLLAHDADPFNRWEAGRRLALDLARRLATEDAYADAGAAATAVPGAWCDALGRALTDGSLDPQFRALLLEMPGNDEVAAEIATAGRPADSDRIHAALTIIRRVLGTALAAPLAETQAAMRTDGPYSPDAASAGRRALANRALSLMVAAGSGEALATAEAQIDAALSMTDVMAALAMLVHHDAPGASPRLAAFRERWAEDELVMDKWFAVQATAPVAGITDRVAALTEDPAFAWKRPNRFRSLVASFAMANPVGFHAADGSGYRFVADWLLRLDAVNPQTAARVSGAFETWRRYEAGRQGHARAAMARIAAAPDLSRNTREIVERLLAD